MRFRNMVINQSLGLGDFDIDNLVLIIAAVGPMHDESPDAARFEFHLVGGVEKPFGPHQWRDAEDLSRL